MDNIVAIIAAHLDSKRFPGKVLANIGGIPMLQHVVERTSRAKLIDRVVIACDQGEEEEDLKYWCTHSPAVQSTFFGAHAKKDVLSLIYNAARAYAAKHIVRITSDCPLIDPGIIDTVIEKYQSIPGCDYCSNIWPERTYPDGLDVEVFSMPILSLAVRNTIAPSYREHVTSWMQKSHLVKKASVVHDTNLSYLRWTVDILEDLAFIKHAYTSLCEPFGMKEVLALEQ